MEALIGLLVGAVIFLGTIGVMIGLTSVLRGLVLTKLWAWYMVPYFGLPAIHISLAIGMYLIFQLLRGTDLIYQDHKQDTWNTLFLVIMHPLFALLIGWVAKFFLPEVG